MKSAKERLRDIDLCIQSLNVARAFFDGYEKNRDAADLKWDGESVGADGARTMFRELAAFLSSIKGFLERNIKAAEDSLYGGLSQVQLFNERTGAKERIVASRPSRKCDMPYISDTMFAAIRSMMCATAKDEIVTTAGFPIAVINASNKVVKVISNKERK